VSTDLPPFRLLTPGPVTTSPTVKQAMLRDHCPWDADYRALMQSLRRQVVRLGSQGDDYTMIPLQGSGTFAVEAAVGSLLPRGAKLLVINNGAYGVRMRKIAEHLGIDHADLVQPETSPVDPAAVARMLARDRAITHVGVVHCETTTGVLNPIVEVGRVAAEYGKVYLVDAISSFGGIPLTLEEVGCHALVSTANKCLQGTPGFAFVLARLDLIEESRGWARSLAMNLYDQWAYFAELEAEGGVAGRHRRYSENARIVVEGFEAAGFPPLLAAEHRSPILTAFRFPDHPAFSFEGLYDRLRQHRFDMFPFSISRIDAFRIGTIGHVFPDDYRELVGVVTELAREWGLI
jgi:2-aminoethylphosphonate-pyruvate transaminase